MIESKVEVRWYMEQLIVFGDNDSDKFVVSLINEEGRARSVSAVSGAVVHTFNIVRKKYILY